MLSFLFIKIKSFPSLVIGLQNPAGIKWMGLLETMPVEGGGNQPLAHLEQIMCLEPSKLEEMLTAIKRGQVSQVSQVL